MVREVGDEFDACFSGGGSEEDGVELKKSAVECYKVARNFLSFCKVEKEAQKFERLCRYILASLESGMPILTLCH